MWWMIETNGERESGKSMLLAWQDDDDEPLYPQLWVKSYHCCSEIIALALNNPQKLITKKQQIKYKERKQETKNKFIKNF